MNYDEAISYLQNLTKFGINLGLGRIEELLNRMGNPHKKLRVIHVGGTNGKGSTSAMISSVLATAGYKVGLFTSPHLHSYTERYRINGKEISREKVAQLITELRPILDKMVLEGFEHPTEFEVSTALAFLYFFEEKVDFLVLEVGLGGEIDSTNVVIPIVSVITNVAMDHMDYLGNTLEEIALVKAGIIKEGGTVITAEDKDVVLEIIRKTCLEKRARLIEVRKQYNYTIKKTGLDGQSFNVIGTRENYGEIFISLLGSHQVINALTAIAVIEVLNEMGCNSSRENLREGLYNTHWAGRMEIMSRDPMVVIDGAHNYAGAVALKNSLQNFFNYDNLIILLGMLGDKEREKVAAELAPLAKAVIVTKPNSPRAGDWQSLASLVKKFVSQVYVIEDVREAVKKGLELTGQNDLFCITGSLYMIAEAREYFI